MSKQYLAVDTLEGAHKFDVFALAATDKHLLSASGASSIIVHDVGPGKAEYPIAQTLTKAHSLGCHQLVTSGDGSKAVSVGFEGILKIWTLGADDVWSENGSVPESSSTHKGREYHAVALSHEGQYLAATTTDGRVNVWDLLSNDRAKIREYTTKGSLGLCIDLSGDGNFTACGHQNGAVYMFNNTTNRMAHSLQGLIKPVRTVKFSPASKILAAAGDSEVIMLYDVASGEQIATLSGHKSWIASLDWSRTGEYLLSGAFDGKVKVWSIETRTCVATLSDSEGPVYAVKWLSKVGRSEGFAIAGASRNISLFREATGG